MANRFTFTGTPQLPKEDAKRPFVSNGKTKAGNEALRLNMGVKASAGNMAFVECFGTVRDSIVTMNKSNEKIEIDWENRLDENVVSEIASYRKCVIDLGEEHGGRKEFIAEYDAIAYLQEHMPSFDGKVTVTGQFSKEWYNGKYFDRFKLQNVYAADPDKKNGLFLTMDVFYDKACVDKADFKKEKKIYVNGYIEQFMGKVEGAKFIPQLFVFSSANYDMENERHKQQFEYKMRFVDIANKTMQRMQWEIVLLRGAEEVEFNESMLTDFQKEQVELGFKSVDDFKPRGQAFGERINEFRLYLPNLKGDFANGLVDTGMKDKEFEARIFVPNAQTEKLETQASGSTKPNPADAPASEVDDDDLF